MKRPTGLLGCWGSVCLVQLHPFIFLINSNDHFAAANVGTIAAADVVVVYIVLKCS